MGQGEGEWLLVCTGVFSGGHENVLELDGMVLVQRCKRTKCRGIVHLIKSQFMFCEFYLKKKNAKMEFLFFF